jgi:hypothetical protein
MSSAEISVALAALLVAASLLLDLPINAWSKTRFVLVAFVVVALTITMTAATGLVVDAGPMQIWPLTDPPWLPPAFDTL